MTERFFTPGRYVVLVGGADLGVLIRRAGLLVRDAIALIGPGPRVDLAYVVRAPFEGPVVESTLRKGTGVLNIDACRVGRSQTAAGRWPPNLILVHSKKCNRDGREVVDAWECCSGCPVPLLDALSGERRSTLTGRSDGPKENPATARPDAFYGALEGGIGMVYADSGGASRFYPHFSGYDAALLWLSRMVTP